jgi:hypothetical protein
LSRKSLPHSHHVRQVIGKAHEGSPAPSLTNILL